MWFDHVEFTKMLRALWLPCTLIGVGSGLLIGTKLVPWSVVAMASTVAVLVLVFDHRQGKDDE